MKNKLQSQIVQLDDPVYQKTMTFDAFPLADVLALGGLSANDAPAASVAGDVNSELVFTGTDGYAPNTSFDELKKHQAYLAYAVHGQPDGQFPPVAQGKAMVSPAPYYVVWKEGKALENEVPWPYKLAKIEVVRFETKYPKVFPKDAAEGSPPRRGFLVFKSECIRCHSVNLEGGDLGPELNVPKNVTEYWDQGTLKAYIRDVSSFRAHDKMPPFPNLSAGQVDDVVAYLAFMKDHKAP